VPSAALPPGITMTISSASPLGYRDRGNFSEANYGPLVELYDDYIRAGTGLAVAVDEVNQMTIDLGGLEPEKEYAITLRLYDGAINLARAGTYTFGITGSGDMNQDNDLYSIPFHNGMPGLDPEFRDGYTETFAADLLGNVQISIIQLGGAESSIPLNSFDLEAIPEPSGGVLALAGGFVALRRRRRRG
jgi:hypothetical protein